MSDTLYCETLLSRLTQAERFYDGPIPPPLRRHVFSTAAQPVDENADTWRQHARDSAARLRRLRPLIGFAGTAEARHAATRAYRRELDWCRECVACWRMARLEKPPRAGDPGWT